MKEELNHKMEIKSRVIKELKDGQILFEVDGVNIPAASHAEAVRKWKRIKK